MRAGWRGAGPEHLPAWLQSGAARNLVPTSSPEPARLTPLSPTRRPITPLPLPSYYAEVFPTSGSDSVAVLDICSSWVSHYPPGYTAGKVTGARHCSVEHRC